MKENNCGIDNEEANCCSSPNNVEAINYTQHWDNAYNNNDEKKLGWYETDLTPTLNLIKKTGLDKAARILNIGAGSTTLIDELISLNYNHLIATDISNVALKNLSNRVNSNDVEYIVDDLIHPNKLNSLTKVDLWVDRAVLHFFTEEEDQNTYFDLLKRKVNTNGYVLLAEFNLNGAEKCSGLPVHRYNEEMLTEKLGTDFELVESFNHIYNTPSDAKRPYIYTLFKKKK